MMPVDPFRPGAIRLVLCTGLWLAASASARPFLPADDAMVLERLPYRAESPEYRALTRLREDLKREPDRLDLALDLATRYIEMGRSDSDPRFAGYAEAILKPWWELPEPPVEVLILRATVRQSRHQFDPALADLASVLRRDPRHRQAWLTRAVILTVMGQYADAERSCRPLVRLADRLVAASCLGSVWALSGRADASDALLSAAVSSSPKAAPEVRLWALTILAEIAARQGWARKAQDRFDEALSLSKVAGRRDPYLLSAYADFLLDQERHAEVLDLLRREIRIDGLLLRSALAEKALGSAALGTHIETLKARFDAASVRGDALHQGDEARFLLHLRNEPNLALRLAQANWSVQREPRDARVLLEAALAAGEPDAARPVLEMIEHTALEDPVLRRLVRRLQATK